MPGQILLQRALGIAVLVTLIAGLTPLLPSALEEATAQVLDETVPVPGDEIVSLRTERSKIFEVADGSRVGRFFTGPVHYQATDGTWNDIDTTLVPSDQSGYAWRNAAGAFTVHFAATASSDDMVLVTDATSSIGFGLEGANPASVGVVVGSTITYPEIKPGIDLVYEVRNGEVKEFIVLKHAPSEPLVFDFPLSLGNLSAADTGESIDLVTAGVRRFFISDLWMIDSAIDPSSGESAFSEDVSGTLVDSAAPTLRVTPDHSWLTAPERVYPVTVDPTITKQTNDDTYVQSNICCTDVSGESEMKSGTYDGGGTKARSLMKFADVQSQIPNAATINWAHLWVWEFHSFSCTPRDVSVHRIVDSWVGNSVRWSNQPGVAAAADTINVAKGFSSSCGAGWVEFPNLLEPVRYWENNNVNYGLEIRSPNETTNDWWKKWRPTDGGHTPYLDVNYTEPDTTPPGAPDISSSSHPSETSWFASCTPSFSWTTPSDASGIAGYSFTLNQTSDTLPDTTLDTTSNSITYSQGEPEGTRWFHVRAKDNAGNWSTVADHYKVNMDCSAPQTPSLTSSTHSSDTCSTSNNPSFSFTTSDLSNIAGYSYVLDQASATTPDQSSEGTATSKSYFGISDGDWWFHVRAQNGAGLWGSPVHYKIKVDAVPPAAPAVSSGTHPDTSGWYASRNPSLGWSLTDFFGVSGYSYLLDQNSSTTPDTTSEGFGTSTSYSGLADGEHYFHVRALDGCSQWGTTADFRIRVDGTPAGAPSVSSSTHPSTTTWYASTSPSFGFSATDISGIDGYSYTLDQSVGTTPDQTSEGATASASYSGKTDGTWHFHVRARNGAGLWSDPSHRQVQIDATNPAMPAISSSSHPNEIVTYRDNDPSFSWSATDNLSGIAGYSYVLDQTSGTTPDTTSEGTGTSKSYSDLADGVWWMHVRAKDNAGNWGVAAQYKVTIDTPAPYVTPTLTAPSGQIDPDGSQVVKNADLLTFSGTITEGAGGALDTAATISACNVVVLNDAKTAEASRIAVPLSSCLTSGGTISGSYAPWNLGVTRGWARLEVIATRVVSGVTETSNTGASALVAVDNDVPMVADSVLGCLFDLAIACDESRTVVVELSEQVKGDFLPLDFTVDTNQVLDAESSCSPTVFCDEVVLTLAQAINRSSLPSVTYAFVNLAGRTQPHDGANHLLAQSSSSGSKDAIGSPDVDVDAVFFADDPAEDATALVSTPQNNVLTLDDNIFQAIADDGAATCPAKRGDDASTTAIEKKCDEAGRELRFARRIVALASKPLTEDDGMAYAPDILLLQETRTQDAARVAGHLNRLIDLDGEACNTVQAIERCYKVAISSSQRILVETSARQVLSDTAIVYNRRALRLSDTGKFTTAYSNDEKCVPTRDAAGVIVFIDEDLDGLNDCERKRKIKRHHMAVFAENIGPIPSPLDMKVGVTTLHFVIKSHLKNEFVDARLKEQWAQLAADKLTDFAPGSQLLTIGGDFNIGRCLNPVGSEPITPATCQERPWWTALTDSADQFQDSVLVRNRVTQADMDEQYRNGNDGPVGRKRIDFLFTRNVTRTEPLASSTNFTCGLSYETDIEARKTCQWLPNSERYSDHLLLWTLAGP